MRRREFLAAMGLSAFAWPRDGQAQQSGGIKRVGVLVAQAAPHPFTEGFRAGMRELGYVEGRNVTIKWRYADGMFSRAVEHARELTQRGVDVIAAHHTPAVKAAMTVTSTIPIVMSPAGAPLETGLVKSLSRPGGNVTGLSAMEAELGSKRLDLLNRAIPAVGRVAILGSRTDPFTVPFVKDFEQAGARAEIKIQPVLIDGPAEFDAAFAAMSAAGARAVVMQPLFSPHSAAIVTLARKHRIALLTTYREITEAGGLMSYAAHHPTSFHRAAVFVDKILKGANPADLPVEQPTKFELVLNLKTAKELGLTVPDALLSLADEVIE